MKILAYISGYDGCGYYRIQLMAKYLNRLPNCHVKISTEYTNEEIDWCDLIIIQKQVNQKVLPYLNYARQTNKKIVTEVDDDYFNIPTWNPAYKYYSDKSQELINFYTVSDAMTVTTKHLAKEVSKHNSNVHVVPNSLDIPYLDSIDALSKEEKNKHIIYMDNKQKALPFAEAEKVMSGRTIIGWGGSPTHLRDLQQATPALVQACKENPEVLVVLMACATQELLKLIPDNQLILVNPSPIFLYPKTLAAQNWDISICPIEDNIFNRSKSNLKYLEFGSRGFACICSDVENYANTVTHEVNGLLAQNTDESWFDNLNILIKDKDKRTKLGVAAKKLVREEYDVSQNYTKWLGLYLSLM